MKEITEYVLNQLKENDVDYCEVRGDEIKNNSFVLKNSNPELASSSTTKGIGARYTINGSLGFLSINDFEKEKIKEIIKKSIRLTKTCGKNSEFGDGEINKANYKVKEKIKIEDLEPSIVLKILKELDNGIKDIAGRFFSLDANLEKKYLLNTEGSKIYSEIPRVGIMYLLTLIKEEKSLQRYAYHGGTGGWEIVNGFKLN